MPRTHTNKKSRESEGERWLIWWARQAERGYVDNGYPHKSPEQALTPGDRAGFVPEATKHEIKCMEIVNKLNVKHHDLYVLVTMEYRRQGEFFYRCRENGGWYCHLTKTFNSVKEPKRLDFLRYVQANYRIKKTSYYNMLKRAQRKVADHVLG